MSLGVNKQPLSFLKKNFYYFKMSIQLYFIHTPPPSTTAKVTFKRSIIMTYKHAGVKAASFAVRQRPYFSFTQCS